MKPSLSFATGAVAILAAAGHTMAKSPFSLDSTASTKSAASIIAGDVLSYYKGNQTGQTVGLLPQPPYYWWNSAVMWASLIDYWHYTGDAQYNDLITQALLSQTGDNHDYVPKNQSLAEGNDDQFFWAEAAMLAAERNFPNPPADQPQWVALAENVFNELTSRWDTKSCAGGLRWQISFVNNGYNYKNSVANGGLFNLGARLAHFTGNKTYSDWAEKTWDWMETVGFLDTSNYAIYDGANVQTACKDVSKTQYSYVNAMFVLGASHMYNSTSGNSTWQQRVSKLVASGLDTFFPNDVAVEIACEKANSCVIDMQNFKGLLHRWYATSTQVAPFTADKILPVLRKSATAAVAQCSGGDNGRQCGFGWANGTYDGATNAADEISVLAAVSSVLVGSSNSLSTSGSGGSSPSQPGSGSNSSTNGSGDAKDGGVGKKNSASGQKFSTAAVAVILASVFGSLAL